MFVSKHHLHNHLGVDMDIAAFFVDRKVPVNNLYWKNRLLYVSRGTGFLFIPLFFDLQHKLGVDKKEVLNEAYITLAEDILDSAAQHEFNHISLAAHMGNCKEIMVGKIKNEGLYNDLMHYGMQAQLQPYKNLGTFSKALNRGDTFLFSLCFLDLPDPLVKQIVDAWYTLVPAFLLMDDLMDYVNDQENKEENSVNDFGEGKAGVLHAIEFLRQKFERLKTVNPPLGMYFEKSLEKKMAGPQLEYLLNL